MSEMKEESQSTVCTKYFNYTHSWNSLCNCRLFAWHCAVVACLLYLVSRLVWHLLPGWSGKLTGLSEECWDLSDKNCVLWLILYLTVLLVLLMGWWTWMNMNEWMNVSEMLHFICALLNWLMFGVIWCCANLKKWCVLFSR